MTATSELITNAEIENAREKTLPSREEADRPAVVRKVLRCPERAKAPATDGAACAFLGRAVAGTHGVSPYTCRACVWNGGASFDNPFLAGLAMGLAFARTMPDAPDARVFRAPEQLRTCVRTVVAAGSRDLAWRFVMTLVDREACAPEEALAIAIEEGVVDAADGR